MARIIGGIGTSHVPIPTIAMAFDKGKQDDPDWKPLFQGYEPVAKWLAEKKPDVLFFCFNDHATTFFLRPLSDLRARREREVRHRRRRHRLLEYSTAARTRPACAPHRALAGRGRGLDISVFQDLPLDHGLHSPLTMMWPSCPTGPAR